MVVWQYKIQNTENTFLHFTGTSTAADQNDFTGKIHDSEIALAGLVNCRICLEARSLKNEPIWVLSFYFILKARRWLNLNQIKNRIICLPTGRQVGSL